MIPIRIRHALAVALVLLTGVTALAQTNTPLPPAPTQMGIDLDAGFVNAFFTETNNWMATFAPALAIGIGIAIALAILTFVGKQILQAFR